MRRARRRARRRSSWRCANCSRRVSRRWSRLVTGALACAPAPASAARAVGVAGLAGFADGFPCGRVACPLAGGRGGVAPAGVAAGRLSGRAGADDPPAEAPGDAGCAPRWAGAPPPDPRPARGTSLRPADEPPGLRFFAELAMALRVVRYSPGDATQPWAARHLPARARPAALAVSIFRPARGVKAGETARPVGGA